jgi:hypothetical protein
LNKRFPILKQLIAVGVDKGLLGFHEACDETNETDAAICL